MSHSIIITFIAVGLPVLCGTIIALAAIMKGHGKKEAEAISEEESALLHEIERKMDRMAQRIESLETIMVEMDRNDKPTHTKL